MLISAIAALPALRATPTDCPPAATPPALTPRGWPGDIRVAINGEAAFSLLFERIAQARRSIEVRAYIWRDDATGQRVASALLAAADRGVEVRIYKDTDGRHAEYHEGNRQSLLHKRPRPMDFIEAAFLVGVYEGRAALPVQRPSPLADALLRHPRVRIERDAARFDHAKVWIFDDARLVFGGMGIGDDAHHELVDVMVELDGPEHVARYRDRLAGAPFTPDRPVEFLLHHAATQGRSDCPMRDARLALIDGAERSLTIAMAYFGDPAFTDAIVRAVERGVRTTVLTGRRASILRWLNLGTLRAIATRTGAPPHLRLRVHPRVVHAKVVVIDDRCADVGSANFTPLSHGVYDELNALIQDPAVARGLAGAIERQVAVAQPIGARRYRLRADIERRLMERHARHARRHPIPTALPAD